MQLLLLAPRVGSTLNEIVVSRSLEALWEHMRAFGLLLINLEIGKDYWKHLKSKTSWLFRVCLAVVTCNQEMVNYPNKVGSFILKKEILTNLLTIQLQDVEILCKTMLINFGQMFPFVMNWHLAWLMFSIGFHIGPKNKNT